MKKILIVDDSRHADIAAALKQMEGVEFVVAQRPEPQPTILFADIAPEPPMKQTMCRTCHGMKTLKINGKKVPPSEWMKHGFASDIGCWCKNPHLRR
jgi:cytochrome c553